MSTCSEGTLLCIKSVKYASFRRADIINHVHTRGCFSYTELMLKPAMKIVFRFVKCRFLRPRLPLFTMQKDTFYIAKGAFLICTKSAKYASLRRADIINHVPTRGVSFIPNPRKLTRNRTPETYPRNKQKTACTALNVSVQAVLDL